MSFTCWITLFLVPFTHFFALLALLVSGDDRWSIFIFFFLSAFLFFSFSGTFVKREHKGSIIMYQQHTTVTRVASNESCMGLRLINGLGRERGNQATLNELKITNLDENEHVIINHGLGVEFWADRPLRMHISTGLNGTTITPQLLGF